MIATPTYPSPLHQLKRLSGVWKIDLWAKRDDLIPQYIGGNKVRKTFAILQSYILNFGVPKVIITNGGVESNHARVVALMGAQLGCQVHLVLHGQEPETSTVGNSFFYRSAGAIAHYVTSQEIGPTIERLEQGCVEKGQSVCVIPGGGHAAEGVEAYAEAVAELPVAPDYIIHASGTGGTQAGLLAGVEQQGWNTAVVGISVARMKQRGIEEVVKLLPAGVSEERVDFRDEYRFGGYEQYGPELMAFVQSVIRAEGIPLDLTYTGKAMFGLAQLVKAGEIAPGSHVVFWHTGGLLNLTSMNS
ncbi:pyridoxal-phosphate dependent enzyme [Halomonas sediminis]